MLCSIITNQIHTFKHLFINRTCKVVQYKQEFQNVTLRKRPSDRGIRRLFVGTRLSSLGWSRKILILFPRPRHTTIKYFLVSGMTKFGRLLFFSADLKLPGIGVVPAIAVRCIFG